MKNGVLLAVLSALVFSFMTVLTKAVSLTIPSNQIVFFRSVIGAVVIFILMCIKGVKFSRTGIPTLVLRGLFGALYLLAYFFTISKIPLADATILVKVSPFFVIIFSFLILKEKIPKKILLLLIPAIVGAIVMIKPFSISGFSIYSIAGLLSAIFAAAATVTIRHLTKKHHAYEIVFYFLFIATIVSIPLMWNDFVVPSIKELIILVGIAVISLIGQLVLTSACTHENVGVVAVTRNIGIVFSVLWGFLFWGEIPDILSILGGLLIIFACFALTVFNKKSKNEIESRKSA